MIKDKGLYVELDTAALKAAVLAGGGTVTDILTTEESIDILGTHMVATCFTELTCRVKMNSDMAKIYPNKLFRLC